MEEIDNSKLYDICFYRVYKHFLNTIRTAQECIYRIEALVESLILRVVYPDIPMRLLLDIGNKKLGMVRPPEDALPYVDDHVFQILFHCLDAENVAFIVACMMSEQRILLHSKWYVHCYALAFAECIYTNLWMNHIVLKL